MNRLNKKILLGFVILVLLYSVDIFSQEFKATVDKTKIGEYERFQVYFTFSDGDINKIKNFRGPSFKGFSVLSGPNQSTSMQIINNSVSSSIEYSYIAQCSKEGKYTIGSASLEYEGQTYNTNLIKIEVAKGTGKPGQTGTEDGISKEELAKNVFIIATPDKRQVYRGEQLTVIYKLYTRLNISSPQISKLPSYNGFWAEDLDSPRNINFAIEMYNGERFRAAVIKKSALFPTKSGELSITPLELKVPVLVKRKRNSRDFFDDFFNDSFFGRTETIEFDAVSNTLKINVLPLPNQNVPSSFKGAVGEYNFNVELDKSEVKQNEAVSLKLTLSGTGNVKLLDIPEIKLPPGFEKYEPRSTEKINRRNIVSGNKTVEYLIVPRIPGIKEIPPFEFSYYSLSQKKYITLTSSQFTIDVEPGEELYESGITGFSKENVRLLSQDIRFIKTSAINLQPRSELTLIQSWFWITLLAPVIILLTIVGIKTRHDKLTGNIQLMRYQKAEKAARSRLKLAKKSLSENNLTGFYTEVGEGLSTYLEDKLKIQKSDFTLSKAVEELNRRTVNSKLISNVKEVMERCEFARFAPEADDGGEAKTLYEKTIKTIAQLENSISGKRK